MGREKDMKGWQWGEGPLLCRATPLQDWLRQLGPYTGQSIFQARGINPTSLWNNSDFSGKGKIKLAWIWILGSLGAVCPLNCSPRQGQRILTKPTWEEERKCEEVPPCSVLARTRSLHAEREQSATLPTPHKGREVKVVTGRKKGHGTPAWSPALQQAPGQALTVSQSGTFANTCGKSRRRFNPWASAQAFKPSGTARLLGLGPRSHLPAPPSPLFPQPTPRGKEECTRSLCPSPAAGVPDQAGRVGSEGCARWGAVTTLTVFTAETQVQTGKAGAALYSNGGGQGRKRKWPRRPLGNVVWDTVRRLRFFILYAHVGITWGAWKINCALVPTPQILR